MPLPIWVLKLDLMVVCWTISGQTDIGGVIQDHKYCNVPEPSPSELGRFGYCDKAPSISGCQLLPSGEGFGHFYLESFAFEDDYMMCCIFSPFKRFGFPSVWKPRFATQMADKGQKEEPLCWLCLFGNTILLQSPQVQKVIDYQIPASFYFSYVYWVFIYGKLIDLQGFQLV